MLFRSSNNTRGAQVRADARITNPLANAHYQIDSALSPVQQMIELTSTLGGNVQWSVNGSAVAPANDGRYFWQLAPGEWQLRAVGRDRAVEQAITVE